MLVSELIHVQLVVVAFFAHQLIVTPLLGDFAVIDNQDPVGAAHRGEPVRYNETGAVFQQRIHRGLYFHLGFGVYGTCGFVKHEYLRVRQDRPGKGDQLFMTGLHQISAFSGLSFVSLFEVHDELMRTDHLCRVFDLFVGCLQSSVSDVFPDRT